MSLLTKQQIADILWMSWDHGHFEWKGFKWDLIKWNKEQTAQFEIDWTEAPENTAIAKVAVFWVTEDNLMLGRKDLVSIEKPVNGADND
jgi:hypothetical protein